MDTDFLYIIKALENGDADIAFFKNRMPPLRLAENLEVLQDLGIIKIDWHCHKIKLSNNNIIAQFLGKNSIKQLHKKRNQLYPGDRTAPEYMKTPQLEKNKPYITKKREDTD